MIISCVWFFVMAPEGETIGLAKGKYDISTGKTLYLELYCIQVLFQGNFSMLFKSYNSDKLCEFPKYVQFHKIALV